MQKPIFFYWDGNISENRLKVLKDCVYSTRVHNPHHPIYIISNTLSDKQFDRKMLINVIKWKRNFFLNTPFPEDKLDIYVGNDDRCITGAREFSDLLRFIVLYRFGGSYIDTDDLCIDSLPLEENIVCRSYDPHTCHYNNLTENDCIPGAYREIGGYNHINFFPRNDCWLNFQPRHFILHDILSNPKLKTIEKSVYIGDGFSWQSLALEACMKNIDKMNSSFRASLTLLYLFEDFVSVSSFWDRCHHGGEMCDIYDTLPGIKDYEWGFYKCERAVAENFLQTVRDKYPHLSHMWLHKKDDHEEWMSESLKPNGKYALSTWIYQIQKEKISNFLQ